MAATRCGDIDFARLRALVVLERDLKSAAEELKGGLIVGDDRIESPGGRGGLGSKLTNRENSLLRHT